MNCSNLNGGYLQAKKVKNPKANFLSFAIRLLTASPAIASGRIVIGSHDERLYCFG
jgi:hypothetical protein